MNILVTGGAGFIGSNLVKRLLSLNHSVRVLDCLSQQIHGPTPILPEYIVEGCDFINGDIRDEVVVKEAVKGIDVIVHFAAETGTGQSMYNISDYFDVNVQGTANLLDILQDNISSTSLKSIVVASSRSVYGEGSYICSKHGNIFPSSRDLDLINNNIFDINCPHCDIALKPVPTAETNPFHSASFYALTKQIQEQSILLFAKTNNINAFALRYQNVYGPGQSLVNPYTGILSIFSNLIREHKDVNIFEDGLESRDFVYIDDVVDATVSSILYSGTYCGPINVGSGVPTTVLDVANAIKNFYSSNSELKVSGNYRVGDIRHNFADLKIASDVLSFKPKVDFEQGVNCFLNWASGFKSESDVGYKSSIQELVDNGLLFK